MKSKEILPGEILVELRRAEERYPMSKPDKANELLDILALESVETNLFRGQNEDRPFPRLFGGQVLAQALVAATSTTPEDRQCHSLHAYFLRPGDTRVPVVYRVERIRDGKSFTTRRIVAIQNGEAIFSMDASFQVSEPGLAHQVNMPELPMPEDLEDDIEVARRLPDTQSSFWASRERPFEMRSVYPMDKPRPDNNLNPVWIRFRNDITASPRLQRYLLAYASDMGLVSTSMLPHRNAVSRQEMQMASLDHAVWYHQEIPSNDWILYLKETTSAAASRGFNRGAFYTRDGVLIASTMQEGLMRVHQGA